MVETGEMKVLRRCSPRLGVLVAMAWLGVAASAARAGTISLPLEARQAMDAIYSGDPDAAIPIARNVQRARPEHPLGYLLEGEALWWKRYCATCEIRYGMADAWKRGKLPEDEAYLAVADKEIAAAEAQLGKSESAELHVYAGMGYALKARVYGLRGENRNVARNAVKGRSEMLRALELDPQMADATAVLGVYNYYVDTLSGIVKVLRVFLGIPGGSKAEGIKQLQVGIESGVLMAVDSRFLLATLVRQYDQKYELALSAAEPLATRFPRNPLYSLLAGNLLLELGRNAKAAEYLQAAKRAATGDVVCNSRTHEMADSLLATMRTEQ
jgi:tetratricopeptide (TPR) repeat protein